MCLLFLSQIDISDFKRSQWNYFESKQQSILISFYVIHNSKPFSFCLYSKVILLKFRLFTLIIKKNYQSSILHPTYTTHHLIDQIILTCWINHFYLVNQMFSPNNFLQAIKNDQNNYKKNLWLHDPKLPTVYLRFLVMIYKPTFH